MILLMIHVARGVLRHHRAYPSSLCTTNIIHESNKLFILIRNVLELRIHGG